MLEFLECLGFAIAVKSLVFVPYAWRRKRYTDSEVDHAWAATLPDLTDLAAKTAVPELLLTNSFGLVSYIDSEGTMRVEHGRYDPMAGQVIAESFDSPEPLAQVIDLHKRKRG